MGDGIAPTSRPSFPQLPGQCMCVCVQHVCMITLDICINQFINLDVQQSNAHSWSIQSLSTSGGDVVSFHLARVLQGYTCWTLKIMLTAGECQGSSWTPVCALIYTSLLKRSPVLILISVLDTCWSPWVCPTLISIMVRWNVTFGTGDQARLIKYSMYCMSSDNLFATLHHSSTISPVIRALRWLYWLILRLCLEQNL